MEEKKLTSLPPPPGAIQALRSGFDAVASHVSAIFLPLTLDVFLWLGPRLKMETLFTLLKPDLILTWQALGISNADIDRTIGLYTETLPRINLFWLLRSIPVGVSSLLYARDVLHTPLGALSSMQIMSDVDMLGWMFLLTVLGWLGGALYFRHVAWLAANNDQNPPAPFGRILAQTILLSIICFGLLMTLGLPIYTIVLQIAQFDSFIAQFILITMGLFSMWAIVPLFFWPHGVFIKRQNILESILSSWRLARFTMPNSSMFVLCAFILALGLDVIWNIPATDTWWMLVGILGHAFVATSLLAASFIYYRDASAWLQTALDYWKAHSVTPQM